VVFISEPLRSNRSYAATDALGPRIEASQPDHRIGHACSAERARRRDRVCASFRRIGTEPLEVACRRGLAGEVGGSPERGGRRRPRGVGGAFATPCPRGGAAGWPSGQGSCLFRGRARRPLAPSGADGGGVGRLRDRPGERGDRPPGAPGQVGRRRRRQARADACASGAGRTRRLPSGRGSHPRGGGRQAPASRIRAARQGADVARQPGEGAHVCARGARF
jgi:hypothetical protein